VVGGTVITWWKSPFNPLTVTCDDPFADSSTVVLPPEVVHGAKPLPVMVTVVPAWTICEEGVSVGGDVAARAGDAERPTVTSAADRAAGQPLRPLSRSITITAANDHTYTEHASAAQIQGIPPRPREMRDAARAPGRELR